MLITFQLGRLSFCGCIVHCMDQYSSVCHRAIMCWFINVDELFCFHLHRSKIVHGYQCCFYIGVRKYILKLFHNNVIIVTQYTG